MKLGYARISKDDQSLNLQIDALKAAGCEQIFKDTVSGMKEERPGLTEVFKYLREGDVLVVWRLDRLGRSITHLIEIVQKIEKRKASFLSLQENIDTTTNMGMLMFHFIGALAQFERNLIVERSAAGLASARARGKFGGRRYMLNTSQVRRLKEIYDDKKVSIKELCNMFDISKASIYKYLSLEKKGIHGEIGNSNTAMIKASTLHVE